ncbi:UDP-N-acetylglucosamine 2-epimerase [Bacillus sp. H-16]|uniref:UDP-N-acetylglucosamine 2-epimerase n=1 Tax=Alteribacter salitolerans TaxID=2912333 RepID=UPI001963BBAD|nr:UDP-N-acetylglucosamine 2-epimerase [Alteribacter salitolerans]MBM7094956.1 UDP-N-acetylglucosamine 2-epimerase [Alteribacter salitolerans]
MYGDSRLNDYSSLKYGLTRSFFEGYSDLTYKGVEIPTTLIRVFHQYIKVYVDRNYQKKNNIVKHSMTDMKHVQHALTRSPKVYKDLSLFPNRKTVVIPASLVSFALENLKKESLILMAINEEEEKMLNSLALPRNFQIYSYRKGITSVRLPRKTVNVIRRKASRIHPKKEINTLFKRETFKYWLNKQIPVAVRIITSLDRLVRKKMIKLFICPVEIINPWTTLGILAKKYNLPFVNMPQVLISDRSLIPTRASHHFAWGRNYKQWLVKRGVPASSVLETGNLNFDNKYHSRSFMTAHQFADICPVSPDHKIFVFTSQPFTDQTNLHIINWIKRVEKENLPAHFLIRPHPYDHVDYSEFFSGSGNVSISNPRLGLYDLLHHSHFVMTVSSNTAIEGALMNNGIIVLQPDMDYHYEHHNNDFNSFLVKGNAGSVIQSGESLLNVVEDILHNPVFERDLLEKAKKFVGETINLNVRPSRVIRSFIINQINSRGEEHCLEKRS